MRSKKRGKLRQSIEKCAKGHFGPAPIKVEVRIYLAEKYDLDGQLYCQMSHEPMPFSLPSGGPFFEAVEFLSLETENAANYLCLSPICAAEFKYALQTDEETLRARIHALDANLPEEQLTIQIEVPLLQHRSVRFRRSHLTRFTGGAQGFCESHGKHVAIPSRWRP